MSKTKTYALSAILDFSERLQCVQLTNSVRIHIRSRAFALLNTPLSGEYVRGAECLYSSDLVLSRSTLFLEIKKRQIHKTLTLYVM